MRKRKKKKITREIPNIEQPCEEKYSEISLGSYDVRFQLTDSESYFVDRCAARWNVDFDFAFVKVMHDALNLLDNTLSLADGYDKTKFKVQYDKFINKEEPSNG